MRAQACEHSDGPQNPDCQRSPRRHRKNHRRDALDGDYGRRVRRFAERRVERVRAIRRALPDEMKADLREARRLTGNDRLDAYREIRTGALDGGYGDRVQEVAVKVQERREACRAS